MDHSPLLQLPAELREAIYSLVIGSNDIHVRSADDVISYSTCAADKSHHAVVKSAKASQDPYFPEDLDHFECATHGYKFQPPPNRLGLSLLRVCKQIYQETALLPFKSNTFVFSNATQLQLFGDSLPADHARAVTRISLVTSFINASRSLTNRGDTGIAKLSGLRHLSVVLGVPNRTAPGDVQLFLRDIAGAFTPHRLISTDILVRLRKQRCSEDELRLRLDQYETWADEVERELLNSPG